MERIIFESINPAQLPAETPPAPGDYLQITGDGNVIGHARITVTGDHASIEISLEASGPDPVLIDALMEEAFSKATTVSLTESKDSDPDSIPLRQKDWAQSQDVVITEFLPEHAPGISALCRRERWKSYADPAVAAIGCAAPGVTTLVAINRATGTVAGFAQVLSDGIVQGYLAQLIVHPAYRRIGLARTLLKETYRRSGAQRLDLQTDDAQAFYETFVGHKKPSYRIYPDQ